MKRGIEFCLPAIEVSPNTCNNNKQPTHALPLYRHPVMGGYRQARAFLGC